MYFPKYRNFLLFFILFFNVSILTGADGGPPIGASGALAPGAPAALGLIRAWVNKSLSYGREWPRPAGRGAGGGQAVPESDDPAARARALGLPAPRVQRNMSKEYIRHVIDRAEKSDADVREIKIAIFVMTDATVIRDLINAAQRGVRVQIVTDNRNRVTYARLKREVNTFNNRVDAMPAGRPRPPLIELKLWRGAGGILHTKILYVRYGDTEHVIEGSYNISDNADDHNVENVTWFSHLVGPEIAEDERKRFDLWPREHNPSVRHLITHYRNQVEELMRHPRAVLVQHRGGGAGGEAIEGVAQKRRAMGLIIDNVERMGPDFLDNFDAEVLDAYEEVDRNFRRKLAKAEADYRRKGRGKGEGKEDGEEGMGGFLEEEEEEGTGGGGFSLGRTEVLRSAGAFGRGRGGAVPPPVSAPRSGPVPASRSAVAAPPPPSTLPGAPTVAPGPPVAGLPVGVMPPATSLPRGVGAPGYVMPRSGGGGRTPTAPAPSFVGGGRASAVPRSGSMPVRHGGGVRAPTAPSLGFAGGGMSRAGSVPMRQGGYGAMGVPPAPQAGVAHLPSEAGTKRRRTEALGRDGARRPDIP